MSRYDEFKKGQCFYISLTHEGSQTCEDVGYLDDEEDLMEAALIYAFRKKIQVKDVKVAFLRNIMDEDDWLQPFKE